MRDLDKGINVSDKDKILWREESFKRSSEIKLNGLVHVDNLE